MATLENEPWAPTALINATAHSGVIDLWGIVETKAQRDAIRVAVEVTPGVRAVNDNITIQPQLSAGYV
jgi:osmotically-inducible protein OsmY